MLNFLRKVGSSIIEARLNSAYWQVAGYVKNEYRNGSSQFTQHDICEMLKKEGFDAVVYKVTH